MTASRALHHRLPQIATAIAAATRCAFEPLHVTPVTGGDINKAWLLEGTNGALLSQAQ